MDKNSVLKRFKIKEERILISNILDKYLKYDQTGISTYTNFLDLRMLKLAEDTLKFSKINYEIYKPNDNCDKSIIYFGDYDNFVTIYKAEINGISHSDVLGTLFSIGLDIDTIGDIFIEDESIYLTNLTRLNSLLESSLYTIKNKKVKLIEVNNMVLLRERFTKLSITVPSYRIDVFISKLAHLSRSGACDYIKDGMVLINYSEVTNVNKILKTGDILSIRKVGKFIVRNELYKSKKDNFVVEIDKYN